MRHTSDGIGLDHIALAILRRDDCIVLVQQQLPENGRLYWVLPGGLVEAGELIVDALAREVHEEAGVQVLAITHLACLCQIDRPAQHAQTLAFIFEVEQWQGELTINDPDAEVLGVELVPNAEAIARLAVNGGWPGIQEPLLAYLKGDAGTGKLWFYREGAEGQQAIASLGA
jgi:8-oxo-dGTP diphosphatase